MKKFIIGMIMVAIFAVFGSPAHAATDPDSFYVELKANVHKSQCIAPVDGRAVMTISHNVVNDIDSGEAGNYWAYDHYTRVIQVYKYTAIPAYCAIVRYAGKFDAQGGQVSPGGNYTLDGNEDGLMKGGYMAKIIGTFNPNNLPVTGNLGQMDYQCDITTGNCPGRWSWTDAYFSPDYHFTYLWWGWLYQAFNNHGFWINAVSGNAGDIN